MIEKRPWGWFRTVYQAPEWKVKILHVNPGQRLSLQSHNWREEHWVVVEGMVTATVTDRIMRVGMGETLVIPLGAVHRIENKGTVPAIIVETQLGARCEEADIVRYQDDYGRVNDGAAHGAGSCERKQQGA